MIESDLVRYSRAGDAFHYRWAARRCLRLIYPNTDLKQIVIEGSNERELAGEYNIDVAEYSRSNNGHYNHISYYQLKHTTKNINNHFNLSDLKSTVSGFADRFIDIEKAENSYSYKFFLITNRPVNPNLRNGIENLVKGETVNKRLKETLEKYTNLEGAKLQKFCKSIELVDGEGGYDSQRYSLHQEISEITAGVVDNSIIENLIALVIDRVLPNSDGVILKEDVLRRFGVSSEKQLFPAASEVEDVSNYIVREQRDEILQQIDQCEGKIIISASGGVGKSVLAQQLVNSLPIDSYGIVYDCFDSGRYRARSSSRHRHKAAFTQIINEMAAKGFCEPLIPLENTQDETYMRRFLSSLHAVSNLIRSANPNALFYVFIDAADNAEMAAREFNQPCFANELLRETIPEACRIVYLCRPERVTLLNPPTNIQNIELKPFTEEETKLHLLNYFPNATHDDILEFHRLSSKNPRVQANALSSEKSTIQTLLESLGPSPTTVDQQISDQLTKAVNSIRDNLPENFRDPVIAICTGLANLPPLVPIDVLAKAANVDENLVKSFVSDIGRPLWLGDNSVQFRDEPTESWFRENFSTTIEELNEYISRLKPLASEFPYVSEALPSLLLSSNNYSELINLALSDEFLPEDRPIDARNIRVYRLKFAFRAALYQKKYTDAAKLAFRSGEEVAGEDRQLNLLSQNVDLIEPLQSENKVQELAFRRQLRGLWEGSENIYSASLLSTVSDFKGEARSYLRAANNWLHIYFKEREEKSEQDDFKDVLEDEQIIEMAFAHLNLFGEEKLVDFIQSWKPPEVIYRAIKQIVKRLIDRDKFDVIDKIAREGRENPHLIIAVTEEMLKVGKFPPKNTLHDCLSVLINEEKCPPQPEEVSYRNNDFTLSSIISFLEACISRGLDQRNIYQALKHYYSIRASRIVSSKYQKEAREIYLRQTALRAVILKKDTFDFDRLLPEEWLDKEDHQNRQDASTFKEVIGGLLPWYILRIRIIAGIEDDIHGSITRVQKVSNKAHTRSWHTNDHIHSEIAKARFEILMLNRKTTEENALNLINELINEDDKLKIKDRLVALRAAFRLDHLTAIREPLLKSCNSEINNWNFEHTEIKTDYFIELARAVLSKSKTEASAYFDLAIESASKFGNEIVQRFEAVAEMANRTSIENLGSDELTYRFIRCAEVVGDYVPREKHFNRNEAIQIAVKLHPSRAFTGLSRWRDRDKGWFHRQLVALATESVKSGTLSGKIAWSLSAIDFEYGDYDFLQLCLENESDPLIQKQIFDSAINKFRFEYNSKDFWEKIYQLSNQYSFQNSQLNDFIDYYKFDDDSVDESDDPNDLMNVEAASNDTDWTSLFSNLNLNTKEGLNKALIVYNKSQDVQGRITFWDNVYHRVSINDANSFLKSLLTIESADKYDILSALSQLPDEWLGRISIRNALPEINYLFGQRFASELCNKYAYEFVVKELTESVLNESKIREGIIQGISNSSDIEGSNTFFGFVHNIAPMLTPVESLEVLKFALSRFELHIEEDYADGPWEEWLTPPEDITDALAGFIWAALGSPRAEIRWQAAHSVRILAELSCQDVIDSLIEWMQKDSDDAFGSRKFPFYNLHARLYLLITLARTAIDQPEILKDHYEIFEFHALKSIRHFLIQKFSADIALEIEKKFPGTYNSDIVERFLQIEKSQYAIKNDFDIGETVDSLWHTQNEGDDNIDLHLAFEFDRYWFAPLANVFGIPAKQVEELARQILVHEWSVNSKDKFIHDPRKNLWNSRGSHQETYYYKSDYPKTDNYSFYLSYHALFSVAARLYEKMPVVSRHDWDQDPWTEWLKGHLLTRNDGKWLADRRDSPPLDRRDWIFRDDKDKWSNNLVGDDFLEGLFLKKEEDIWLNIHGYWSDNDSYRVENYSISSAFVTHEVSQSLLNALSTCKDPNDFKIPEYNEDQFEINEAPFELTGWIYDSYIQKGIDERDPYSGNISYPPYSLSESVIDKLQLSTDSEKRFWYLPNDNTPSLHCRIWGKFDSSSRDNPIRQGRRLNASLNFLSKLCSILNRELIIKVYIERRLTNKSYRTEEENEQEKRGPKSKVYIFSEDGKLRDERTSYQLR